MPVYDPGDLVNLRFEGDPQTAELVINTASYTVANGGLELMSDGGLVAIIRLPAVAATVLYAFSSGGKQVKAGTLRVREAALHERAPEPPPEPSTGPPVSWRT